MKAIVSCPFFGAEWELSLADGADGLQPARLKAKAIAPNRTGDFMDAKESPKAGARRKARTGSD
jgi:hypothetical protein